MSQIHIRKSHSLDHAHAPAMAEHFAAELTAEYQADYQWQGNDLTFKSRGIEGLLRVGEDEVEIRVRLGMLLRPLMGKIESGIRSRLDGILG